MPRRSILVVDDESDIRLEICDYLTRKGYLCEAAENGAQALARLREQGTGLLRERGVGLLITDIKMPQLDGKELARHARRLAPRMPVIAITGHGSHRGLKQIDAVDADVAMAKPLKLPELLRHVERLFG